MTIRTKEFQELDLLELYALLRLRSEVFVVEQKCVYQDVDGHDAGALHVLGSLDQKTIAYARVLAPDQLQNGARVGRVVVDPEYRERGYGRRIVRASLRLIEERFQTRNVRLSAQVHLIPFYKDLGFKTEGDGYLEDGIPHIAMQK